MDREIKFRGLRTTGSGFIYGYLNYDRISKKSFISQDHVYKNSIGVMASNCYEVVSGSVGQYTGLKDKCGKEIFEGDIYEMLGKHFTIIFENGAFCVTRSNIHNPTPLGWRPENEDDCCVDDFSEKIVIIGNIHENPELCSQ